MKTIVKIFSAMTMMAFFAFAWGCEKESINTLSVSASSFDFDADGGTASMTINTDAGSWNIINPAADWLTLSSTTGTQPKAMVSMSVSTKTIEPRIDTLIITAGNANPIQIIVTQASSEYLYSLSANSSTIIFKRAGNTVGLTVYTSAPKWHLSCNADWLQVSDTVGELSQSNLTLTALANAGAEERTGTITITAEFAPTVTIKLIQKGEYYPSYNTHPIAPDASGMSSTATELAAQINLGWNIGNTMEAIGGETAWGNPKVTKTLIDSVKANGFNAIRIPCSWSQYQANPSTAQLKDTWLARVKEVVQYCVDNDMYVLLNIHWDGGWLENNCTTAKQEENNAKQKAFWEQIATTLRDFDEHVMFASANEPNVEDATQMRVLNSYHQTFIDAVRATGGRNAYRVLVVQGPSTDIEKTNKLMTTLPTDKIPNKMMVEVHYYTPYQFCIMAEDATWGKMFYYWGANNHSTTDTERNATWGEEADADKFFGLMKTQFVDKGIPVILGEYAAMRRTNLTGESYELHEASRLYYLEYVTKQMKANGLLPFYWDAGGLGNHGSGLFNRTSNTVFDRPALDALLKGAATE